MLTKKKERVAPLLVVAPVATDFTLDFSADLLLKQDCCSLGFEIGGPILTILKNNSVLHNFLSFLLGDLLLPLSDYRIPQVWRFVNTFRQTFLFFLQGQHLASRSTSTQDFLAFGKLAGFVFGAKQTAFAVGCHVVGVMAVFVCSFVSDDVEHCLLPLDTF